MVVKVRLAEMPAEIEKELILYECENVKKNTRVEAPIEFVGVVQEGSELRRVDKVEVIKKPNRIWIVRMTPNTMTWGIGDLICHVDDKKLEFGMNGKLSFKVSYPDSFVERNLNKFLMVKEIRKNIKSEMNPIIAAIMIDYVKKHGLEGLDEIIIQEVEMKIKDSLDKLFNTHELMIESFTISEYMDYSEYEEEEFKDGK